MQDRKLNGCISSYRENVASAPRVLEMHFDVVMISTLIRKIGISLQPYTFTKNSFSGGKSDHFKKARTCIERSEEPYGPGEVLLHMGYIGTCRGIGYDF